MNFNQRIDFLNQALVVFISTTDSFSFRFFLIVFIDGYRDVK